MSTAIAEPPAPATPPTPKPASKPGEEAASFLESLHGGKQKPKEADKPVAEEKAKTDKDAADKAAAAKPTEVVPAAKKKAVATKPSPPPAEPDYEKIAEAAGRGAAAAIKKAEPEKKAEADPQDDLDEDDRDRYAAYVQMEKDRPARYKGFGKKFLASAKEADEWEAQWLKDHPGQKVDENSAEYKEQESKLAIHYDDLHFQQAVAALEIEKREAKARAAAAPLLEDERRKEQVAIRNENLARAKPARVAQMVENAREYFGALGDDFKEVLDPDGNISKPTLIKLVDADPHKNIALTIAETVEGFSDELYCLTPPGPGKSALLEFNGTDIVIAKHRAAVDGMELAIEAGDKTKARTFRDEAEFLKAKLDSGEAARHDYIASFVSNHENSIASLPLDEQAAFIAGLPESLRAGREGKRCVTSSQYNALPDNQKDRYFRLNHRDMAHLFALDQAAKAKEMISAAEKRESELNEKRGWKKVDAIATASNQTAVIAPKPQPSAPLSPSPSGAIEPRQALPSTATNSADKNPAGYFAKLYLG